MGFFVKNVENVQGDERDVIVFSTTFGRDRNGAFRRSFGVLGQAGGERRLNVAVTRAREKVVLLTSIPVRDVSDWLTAGHAPDKDDYGVELGAPADAARVQVRLVGSDRPGSLRSAQRDKDHEVSWCGDFTELRALLARTGGEMVVERALEPGVQQVKTVSSECLGNVSGSDLLESAAKKMGYR